MSVSVSASVCGVVMSAWANVVAFCFGSASVRAAKTSRTYEYERNYTIQRNHTSSKQHPLFVPNRRRVKLLHITRCAHSILTVMTTSAHSSEAEPPASNFSISHTEANEARGMLSSIVARPCADLQTKRARLVFLHGSYHSSWCWETHFLPFFASHGYECHAPALRGTHASFGTHPNTPPKIQIDSHILDIRTYLTSLHKHNSQSSSPIILIAHSMGGMVAQKLLQSVSSDNSDNDGDDSGGGECEKEEEKIDVCGLVLMCSVPPSGNGPMTLRFVRGRGLRVAWDIVRGIVLKRVLRDAALCRLLFFQPHHPPDHILHQHMRHFQQDSRAVLDVADLNRKLPIRQQRKYNYNQDDDNDGCGGGGGGRNGRRRKLEVLVLGAECDALVDEEGVRETAEFFGVEFEMLSAQPHDVMLSSEWHVTAQRVLEFVEGL